MNAVPRYEVRRHSVRGYDDAYEVYEFPSKAAPYLREPRRLGGLAGANFRWSKRSCCVGCGARRLRRRRTAPAWRTPPAGGRGIATGLLFRAVAPMRSRARSMPLFTVSNRWGSEEAAYWLGMALHRKNPRRILSALRIVAAEEDLR